MAADRTARTHSSRVEGVIQIVTARADSEKVTHRKAHPPALPRRAYPLPCGPYNYHIVSPHKAAFGIANVRQALIERTQTTLRHVVGARVLQDVIERREEIAQSIGEIIEDVAAGWGVQVESMLIKDIIFSQELQESLSMAAQSKRIGESKIIAAKAEVSGGPPDLTRYLKILIY